VTTTLTSLLTLAVYAGVAGSAHAESTLGVTIDAGVPDGAAASIVYRPISRVRLHAGATHNMVSTGARAGITLSPLRTWLSPTLSFDVGSYPEGDANPLVQRISSDPSFQSAMLERVGYRYANAHLGLEFGRQRATFYIHGGASYVATQVHGLDAASEDGMTTVTFTEDPQVRLLTVSARIGLIIYFL